MILRPFNHLNNQLYPLEKSFLLKKHFKKQFWNIVLFTKFNLSIVKGEAGPPTNWPCVTTMMPGSQTTHL